MDVKNSEDTHGSPAANSRKSSRNSPSSSSPMRRSARLSGKLVASNLQKQVMLKNFLGPQIKETPRTLLEGFVSKQRNASLVRSDKTLELSVSRLESSAVLNESREKGKSFHEESFLHPIQQKTSLPSGRKRRPAAYEVQTQKSPKKTTDVSDGNRNWRRPKPVGRFNVKRQTRDTIEAAVVGGSPPRKPASHQSQESASNLIDEEDKELEFTEESIDSTTISGIGLSGSRKDEVDRERGEEGNFADLPSEVEMEKDVDMETAETEVEKDVEYGTNSDAGSAKEETSQRNKSYKRRESESRSHVVSFNKSRASEAGEKLMTQQSWSSSRKPVTSSRLSLAAQRSNVSNTQLTSAVEDPSIKVPQLQSPVQQLSPSVQQLSPQVQQLSTSVQQLSPQIRLSPLVLQLSTSVQQLSTSVQQLSVPVQQSSSPAPQSSVVSEEVSAINRMEGNMTPRVQVSTTSRMEVATTSMMKVAGNSREQEPLTSVEVNEGAKETHLSTSQVEDDDTQVEASETTLPRLLWKPRLPPKAKTPMSVRRNRRSDVIDVQPQTSSAARLKSRGAAVASRGRQSDRRVRTSIPRSLSHAAFQFFAGMKVSKEALEEVDQISEVFWSNVVEDLELYAKHGKRSIVDRSDVEVLMKRQRFVTDNTSLNALIEKYLALEDRETLIPIARSGNQLE